MDFKLTLVILVLVTLAGQLVLADIYYDRVSERAKEVTGTAYKCSPGVTTVKIVTITRARESESDSESGSQEILRTHMNSGLEEKKCVVCVCSVDGTEEHCRGRPARNVNECLRLDTLRAEMDRGLPYNHDRILAYRIRRVGNVNDSTQCTPFVSEYNDCSEENQCSGCTRCTCDKDGNWECKKVVDCAADNDDEEPVELDVTLDALLEELKERKKNRVLTPAPKPKSDVVVGRNFEDYFSLPPRLRRSIHSNSLTNDDLENGTIKFYNTGNEISEDKMLKNSNDSGTVKAHKFGIEAVPKNTRRTSINQNYTKTIHNLLHIEPTQNADFDQDAEDKVETLNNKKVLQNKNIVGNYSQSKKDADISKIVANELKNGIEFIGERGLNPVSNITFTPENDTEIAMAFVAGNLLNKLWEMEKHTGYGSNEADILKHEKINELLDLFKDPLSIKQETLLKNVLEKLVTSIAKTKNINNFTFCETFFDNDTNEMSSSDSDSNDEIDFKFKTTSGVSKLFNIIKDSNKTTKFNPLSKMKNILNLLNDLERVQNNIEDVGRSPIMLGSMNIKHSVSPVPGTIKNFRNIVNEISKLLTPKTKTRGNKKDVINYNDNMAVKDQLILQYIKLIESNPSCLLRNNLETEAQPSILKIEGNILKNISEFLKIKSFEDLIKMMRKETTTDPIKQNITTTAKSELRSENKSIPRRKNQPKMKTIQENLKKHLKAVIHDLEEMQSMNNSSEIKNYNIAHALPCIYGLLNDKNTNFIKPKNTDASIQNIKFLFNDFKADLKSGGSTRRQISPEATSQSLNIFDNLLKSMDKLLKQKTRRNSIQTKPKTVAQIASMIDKAKLTHSLFDNMKIFSNITEKNQLMLLKAIKAEIKNKEIILTNINNSLDAIAQLPADELREIQDFIETTNKNIDLGQKVVQNIFKKNKNLQELTTSAPFNEEGGTRNRESKKAPEYRKSNFEFTRDQIISQLIKNRVITYMKKREATGMNLSNNIKYQVGRNILSKLRAGNHELAKELFKIFISTTDEDSVYYENDRAKKLDHNSVFKLNNFLGEDLDESDLEAMDAT